LDIKTATVGTYVQRIYEKLHVRGRREIIALYKRGGDGEPAP
jgi:DNA-binding CsgD family transcriptional regulator